MDTPPSSTLRRKGPSRARGIVAAVLAIAIAAGAYIGTALLYASDIEGNEYHVVAVGDDAPLTLTLVPRGLDPVTERFSFQLEVGPDSDLLDDAGVGLTAPVQVQIRDAIEANATSTVEFGAEVLSSEVVVNLLAPTRRLEAWPFDAYVSLMRFSVMRIGPDGQGVPMSADIAVAGGVPGWDFAMEAVAGTGETESAVPDIRIATNRSFSTLVFAGVLTLLMIAMAVIAIAVSVSVFRKRRRVEPAFLGWIAGMLFAVPALRNFLPGQPPIGTWVDFLIVLWVIVSLVVALVLLVSAWFRSTTSHGVPDDT